MIRIICYFSKKPKFGEVVLHKNETYIVSKVWEDTLHSILYRDNIIIDQQEGWQRKGKKDWVVQLRKFEMKDFPDYGDLMKLKDFVRDCKDFSLINYDGSGNYATKKEMSTLNVYPSEIVEGTIFDHFTHVMWFNR